MCCKKVLVYSYTHFIVMHFRSTTSKTPIAMATTSKGKLHASTVLRNEYGRSTQLDFVTIDESSDLMNYSLLVYRILEFFVIFLCKSCCQQLASLRKSLWLGQRLPTLES